ncbi:MAG: hypothetical protein ACKO24_10985 [Leptolyngbyaceae cyanobacterium]
MTGSESAQVRNEDAVKRHFRLSCVARSILQRATCSSTQSEKFQFAQGQQTVGQKHHTLPREALAQLLQWVCTGLEQGRNWEQLLEELMPT